MIPSTRSLHFVTGQNPSMLKNYSSRIPYVVGKLRIHSSHPNFALFPKSRFYAVKKITANPCKGLQGHYAKFVISIGANASRVCRPTCSCQDIFSKLIRDHQTAFFSSISSKENDDEDVANNENDHADDFRGLKGKPDELERSEINATCLNEKDEYICMDSPSEDYDIEHTYDGEKSASNPVSLPDSNTFTSSLTDKSTTNEVGMINHDADESGHSTKKSIGEQEGNYGGYDPDKMGTTDDSTTASKASLEDLLKTDIFSLSWAVTSPSTSTEGSYCARQGYDHNSHNVRSSHKLQSNQSQSTPGSESLLELLQPDSRKSSTGQLSPAESKFNSLLEESASLLQALSPGNEPITSSTLQLMDFDKVMTELSRFHLLVDSEDAFEDQGTHGFQYGQTKNDKQRLKQNASDTCLELLRALESNYDVILETSLTSASFPVRYPKLMPNTVSYNLSLHALANSGKGHRIALEAYSILNRMIDRCKKYVIAFEKAPSEGTDMKLPPPPPEPSIITYNSVIHAISKSGANDAGHLAEEICSKMENWKNECDERNGGADFADDEGAGGSGQANFYSGVVPNVRTLACLLDAWVNTKSGRQSTFAPERSEAILEYSIQKRRAFINFRGGSRGLAGDDGIEDDEYATTNSHKDDDVADDKEMDDFPADFEIEEEQMPREFYGDSYEGKHSESYTKKSATLLSHSLAVIAAPFPRPNAVMFNTCLDAWAQSGRGLEAAVRAKEILDRMEALASSGELDLPDENLLHNPKDGFDENDDYSSEAYSSMKPNSRTYSIVMNAFSRIPWKERGTGEDAASQCEAILSRMEERAANGESSIRPNLMHYTTAISAWARMRNVEYAASRAENILNRMIDLYYSGISDELPRFDGDSKRSGSHDAPFNAVITAYARSKDPFAAERAIAIFDRLQSSPITPTLTTFNATMDVCAKRGNANGAIGIFNQIRSAGLTPDATSYNTVLDALARGEDEDSAYRAWDFLCQMECEKSAGLSDVAPTVVGYSSVINAYAQLARKKKENGIDVIMKAKMVYDKLSEGMKNGTIHGFADPYANSCFLNCCSNINGMPSEKRDSLIIAINAFEEMKKHPSIHGEPNEYTYGTMLKVSAKLTSSENEKLALMESLFIQACNRGLVSRGVMEQFIKKTPNHFSSRVILSQGASKREIPESWYRNVPRSSWPVR